MAVSPEQELSASSRNGNDLGDDAYVRLRSAIQNRELPSGTRIMEKDVCTRLNISRTPAREAIYRLEADGLLTHVPRRGLMVTVLDHNAVLELYSLREVLEGASAAFAAQHASAAELAMMEQTVEEEAESFENAARLDRLNRSLHGLIQVSANNRYLSRTLANIAATAALLPTMLSDPHRARVAHEEHQAIVRAVAGRDPVAAEKAAREHIQSARRLRLRLIAGELAKSEAAAPSSEEAAWRAIQE